MKKILKCLLVLGLFSGPSSFAFNLFEGSRKTSTFFPDSAPIKNRLKSDSELPQDWLAIFTIANDAPGDFSNDGIQGVSYDDLSQVVGSTLRGIPLSKLALWTSSHDTLPRRPTVEISSPESMMKEVPMIRRDKNFNDVFDEGDSLYFFGHGSSHWKRIQGDFGPLKYHLSHSPYGFYQQYYLGVSPNSQVWELSESKVKTPFNDAQNRRWFYRHAERELVLRDETFPSHDPDDSTGIEWHWIYLGVDDFSTYEVTHPQTENLSADAGASDSAYAWLKFFPLRGEGGNQASYRVQANKDRWGDVEYLLFSNNQSERWLGGIRYDGHHLFQLENLKSKNNRYSIQVLNIDVRRGESSTSRFDGYTLAWKDQHQYDARNPYILPHDFGSSQSFPELPGMQLIKLHSGEAESILGGQGGNWVDDSFQDLTTYFMWDGEIKVPKISAYVHGQSMQLVNQAEYLIITPSEFIQQSQELASLRSGGKLVSTFQTGVVSVEQIFQYYSGGRPSPVAIRDYLQFLHSQPGARLKYVLLIGDTHFDYRDIKRTGIKLNVPTYEEEDLASDDFFAILDAGEYLSGANYTLDLYLGRLPVNDAIQFENYIEKVKGNELLGKMSTGLWRNQFLLTADDYFQREYIDDLGFKHVENSEEIFESILSNSPSANLDKLYLSNYDANGNFEKPEAYRDLVRKFQQGQSAMNFVGHGGVDQLADEKLMDQTTLSQLSRSKGYPIISAFSCQVGRIDRLESTSLAQEIFLYKGKGPIAFVAGTRDSYSDPNKKLSLAYFQALSDRVNHSTIGEALVQAKGIHSNAGNNSDNANTEKYLLLGEPVLPLSRPNLNVQFDSIPDTLQALQKVRLKGKVNGAASSGKVYIKVTEQFNQAELYAAGVRNDPARSFNSARVDYSVPGKTLYAEVLNYKDNQFSTEFYTPRKLSFGDTNAIMTAYAWKPGYPDNGGFFKNNITLSGTSPDADSIQDNAPPVIQAHPCGVNPVESGFYDKVILANNPACIEFQVVDRTGIDLSEAVDEGVTVEVENLYSRQHAVFQEVSGKRVTFRIDLGEYAPPGEYEVEVRALDILGNFGSQKWLLKLSGVDSQVLDEVYNVPNPMTRKTKFFFKTSSQSAVKIKIFDQRGRLVKKLENVRSGLTSWNGRDRFGNLLGNGIYFYKVISQKRIEGTEVKTQSKLQKLIISN